jgi:hypothetical protein
MVCGPGIIPWGLDVDYVDGPYADADGMGDHAPVDQCAGFPWQARSPPAIAGSRRLSFWRIRR